MAKDTERIGTGKAERDVHYSDSKYSTRGHNHEHKAEPEIPTDLPPADDVLATNAPTPPYPPTAGQWITRGAGALYDRWTIRAGQAISRIPHCFFNYPVGSKGPDDRVRTFLDTNIYSAFMLQPPSAAVVERVLFVFAPDCNAEERNRFISRTYFEFRINQRTHRRAPILLGAVEADAMEMVKQAEGKLLDMKRIGQNLAVRVGPHYIPSLLQFELALHTEPYTPERDLDLYAFLDGQEDHPTQ